jgi:hypothetical protein
VRGGGEDCDSWWCCGLENCPGWENKGEESGESQVGAKQRKPMVEISGCAAEEM